jgi:hypothetical protein
MLFAFFVPIPVPALYLVRPGFLLECPQHGAQPGCPLYGSITAKYLQGYGADFQYPNFYMLHLAPGIICAPGFYRGEFSSPVMILEHSGLLNCGGPNGPI